ncbi:CG10949 [Drosophila busckii]|uniref:CG10949 n=1 Tax=Drosophila busckii TaxID=30019 RepID=A0A0M4E4G9_DROBS|nr:uncharacterized protein LOC108602385 [Drosophila busckii]ALC38758.1 CG10949 [Drosophila busckii]
MDDLELIKLIENFPILYDKDSARSAKNAANKDAAWKLISEKVGASERACITRWKSIRDRFGKEFRRFQETNSPTYWDMFPRLLFLKDHYKHGLVKHKSLEGLKVEQRVRKPRRTRKETGEEQQPLDDKTKEQELEEQESDILFCQELIELVKQHTVLYDRHQIRNSKNLAAKNDAWCAISQSLHVSEEVCYKRWKQLRDRFAREYRNQQLDQSTPISWRYFNDLLFLGRHFRKGVPLVLEHIKKRGRPPKARSEQAEQTTVVQLAPGEHIWGTDYPYSNDELDQELAYDETQQIEVLTEAEQQEHMDLVELSNSLEPEASIGETVDSYNASGEELLADSSAGILEADSAPPSAENLIGTVISNMETVLQQSKECLQLMQQTQTSNVSPNNSLLNKVQMLLDGLSPDQRGKAERKIVHFLCECQIKTLDGQEIEDVTPCHIY